MPLPPVWVTILPIISNSSLPSKIELLSIKREDYDLLVAGCERLLEKENEKPVELTPDMFSGLNAMLRKDKDSEEEFGMTSDEIKEHNEELEEMNLDNINLSDTPDIP